MLFVIGIIIIINNIINIKQSDRYKVTDFFQNRWK